MHKFCGKISDCISGYASPSCNILHRIERRDDLFIITVFIDYVSGLLYLNRNWHGNSAIERAFWAAAINLAAIEIFY